MLLIKLSHFIIILFQSSFITGQLFDPKPTPTKNAAITTTDPYDWLFQKITTMSTTTRSVKVWPKREFKLKTMHPMCGHGRPVPFDYRESSQLLAMERNGEIPIVNKAKSQQQYPWTAVIYPNVDNLPMICYGVIVDDDLVLTTKQCLNTLTMASNKQTVVVRAGLQQAPLQYLPKPDSINVQSFMVNVIEQSHDMVSNNKSIPDNQALLAVINITSKGNKKTILSAKKILLLKCFFRPSSKVQLYNWFCSTSLCCGIKASM